VYGPGGNYLASCVNPEEAAILCAVLGKGSQARNGHAKKNVVWDEGSETQSAAESYDFAAGVMYNRVGR
jgi:hypothetical protein